MKNAPLLRESILKDIEEITNRLTHYRAMLEHLDAIEAPAPKQVWSVSMDRPVKKVKRKGEGLQTKVLQLIDSQYGNFEFNAQEIADQLTTYPENKVKQAIYVLRNTKKLKAVREDKDGRTIYVRN